MVQTAGSSNPQAGAEGQIQGVINAEQFRERIFAAREGKAEIGTLAPSLTGGAAYLSVPSAAHSMQHGSGSLELQQLQEINAGIKQVIGMHFQLFFCFVYLLHFPRTSAFFGLLLCDLTWALQLVAMQQSRQA
jgi:hypothetical protein